MQIHYKNKKIEKLLTSEEKLRKKFGKQVSEKVIQRMNEIDAAENLVVLIKLPARAHPHEPKKLEIFSIDILKHKHSTRLLIKPYGEYNIEDYLTIKEVEIQEITKNHS